MNREYRLFAFDTWEMQLKLEPAGGRGKIISVSLSTIEALRLAGELVDGCLRQMVRAENATNGGR